jgi:hypothetical protein
MSDAIRAAFLAGIILGLVYAVIVIVRLKDLKGQEMSEAVGLFLSTFPIPGAGEMMWKAIGSESLPIFNEIESRAALFLGGALLIGTFVYGLFAAFKHAITSQRAAGP